MERIRPRALGILLDIVLFAGGCAFVSLLGGRVETRPSMPEARPSSASRREHPQEVLPSPEETFREALRALATSVVEERGPRGSISGRVVTPEGLPVPGVRIECAAEVRQEERPFLELGFEERILEYMRGHARGAEAMTDAGGSFRIGGLLSRVPHRVTARHEAYEISPASGVDARTGQHLAFIARPIERFLYRVDCILPDGSAPPEASIFRCDIDGRRSGEASFSWTPEKPVIASRVVLHRVCAQCSLDPFEYRSDPVEVPAVEEGEPALVTIHLKTIPEIKGRIYLPQGQRPDSDHWHIQVHAVPVDRPRRDPSLLSKPQWDLHLEYAPGGYSYRSFRDLAPGLFWVAVEIGGSVVADAFVEVRDRAVFQDLSVPPIPPDRALRLWACRPDGRALEELSLSFDLPDGSWGGSPPVFQEEPHRWILVVPERVIARPEAGWILVAEKKQLGKVEVPFVPGRDSEVRIEYTERAALLVEIEGYLGSPYPRGSLRFFLRPTAESGLECASEAEVVPRWSTGSAFALLSVQPGEYELSAFFSLGFFSPPAYGDGMPVVRQRLALRSGLNEISLSLPPLHEVTVTAPGEGSSNTEISLFMKGSDRPLYGFSAKPAGQVLPPLPPGTYVLRRAEGEEVEFSLPGPTEVVFDPRERWGIEVEIAGAGHLAEIGLMGGDVVVGIEGEGFEKRKDIERALAGGLEKDTVRLEVLRAGKAFQVSADPKRLVRPDLLGGRLRPRMLSGGMEVP